MLDNSNAVSDNKHIFKAGNNGLDCDTFKLTTPPNIKAPKKIRIGYEPLNSRLTAGWLVTKVEVQSAKDENVRYEFLCDDWLTENSHETVLYNSEEMGPPSRPRSTKSNISNNAILSGIAATAAPRSRSESRQSKTSVQVKDRSTSRQSHTSAVVNELNRSIRGVTDSSSDSEESSESILKVEREANSRQSSKSDKLVVEQERSRKSSRKSSVETRSVSKNSLSSSDDSDDNDSDATLQADNDNQSLHSAKSEKSHKSQESHKSLKSQKSAHSVLEQLARKFSVKSSNSEDAKSKKSSRAASANSKDLVVEQDEAYRPVSKQSTKSKQSTVSSKMVINFIIQFIYNR